MNDLSTNSNNLTQVLIFSTDPDPVRILTDYPPFIPGYKSLSGDIAGVNRNMVNSDRRGLLGYVFPYLNMDSTDQLRVYLGTRPTLVAGPFPVGAYINQLVPFYIPVAFLEQMYATPVPIPETLELFCSIQRVSENERNFPPLPLLYKPFGPGELDTRHDLPNNQGLALPVPSETVIDKTVIENGMFVTIPQYLYQAIGDLIYLAIGPRELSLEVTALGDVLFELTPGFLKTLPDTDKVAITYEIVDIVENGSGWSSAVSLALKPNTVLLAAPLVDESDAEDNLDHDALDGGSATVVITGQFKSGDIINLTVVLFTSVGDRLERIIKEDVKGTSRSLRIPLENSFIQNGIRASMVLSYTKLSGGITQHSKCTTVTISGTSLPAAAPTIEEQQGNELPADTSPAHVHIPTYWPLLEGATVSLYWQVTLSNGVENLYIFSQIINDITQPVIFTVTGEYIDRFESCPLTVLYKIENPGKTVVQSGSLKITIGAAAELPAPLLVQALPGNRVQPLDTRNTATVRVSDPAMNPRKTYTLTIRGRAGFGSPVITSKPGNNSGELLFDLPPTAIPANIGSYIKISCVKTESGKPDQPSGVSRYEVLPVANPQINFPQMSIEEAKGGVLDLNNFSGDAHWILPPYLFQAIGTRMRVAMSDDEHVIMLFDAVINATHEREGLKGTISREELKKYKDGTQVFGLSVANYSDRGGVDTFFPVRELTIKTQILARPAITQLIDNQGAITGPVANGGACDATSPQLVGTATPASKVHLFNGDNLLGIFDVESSGLWRTNVNIGLGRHVLTAKTPDGQLISAPWVVTIRPDLYDDTSFVGGFNGWSIGPGGATGYLAAHTYTQAFWNITPAGRNYAGAILYKYLQLVVGASYRFVAQVGDFTGSGGRHLPVINLRAGNMLNTPLFTLGRQQNYTLQGDFTANSATALFEIVSHQGTPDGNDFLIFNLLVQQLTNPPSA
ncbi:hypothetical protein [Pseudomonas sp. MC6]|jgi:hypothetical protein